MTLATLPDIRCPHCGRLLLRGVIIQATIEIKCRSEVCRGRIVRIEPNRVE